MIHKRLCPPSACSIRMKLLLSSVLCLNYVMRKRSLYPMHAPLPAAPPQLHSPILPCIVRGSKPQIHTCLNIQAILSQAIIKAVSMTWLKRCWLFMPSAKKALRKSRTLFILSSPRCHAPFTWRPHQLRREYKYTVQCRKKSIILIFLSSLSIHKNRCRIYHITLLPELR